MFQTGALSRTGGSFCPSATGHFSVFHTTPSFLEQWRKKQGKKKSMAVQKCLLYSVNSPGEFFSCSFDPQTVAWGVGALCLNRLWTFDPATTQVSSCSHSNNGHDLSQSVRRSHWKPQEPYIHFPTAAQNLLWIHHKKRVYWPDLYDWLYRVPLFFWIWSHLAFGLCLFQEADGAPLLAQQHFMRERDREMSRSLTVSVKKLHPLSGNENRIHFRIQTGWSMRDLGLVCIGSCILNKYQSAPRWTLHGLIALGLICLVQR